MKKPIFFLLFILGSFISGKLYAQINVVRNGGLEQRDTCPYGADQIKIAQYWSCIDTPYISSLDTYIGDPNCSPEFINTCSSNVICSAPVNAKFYQYPHGGNGMADVLMYADDSAYPSSYKRDYLQGHLSVPLTAGQTYCVTFYVVMANGAAYAVNHIGAYLDDGTMDTTSNCGQPQTTHIPQILDTSIISDTLNWIRIQGSFIANGTERLITIGNFFDSAHTAQIRRNYGHVAYYEVDDVSVIASNATAYAGPDVTITAGCSTYIGADVNGGGMPCYWYILGDAAAIDSGGQILVHPTATTTYVVSMDLCGTVTTDTVTVNVTPCSGTPVASFTHTGTHRVDFTYTGAVDCIDSIKWNFGDGSMSTGINPSHTYTANGTYTVCATVYTYCGNDSVCSNVAVTTVASPFLFKGQVGIYPNPATNEVSVENAQGCDLRILNMLGQEAFEDHILNNRQTENISGLTNGIYIVQIVNGIGEKRTIRLVKE